MAWHVVKIKDKGLLKTADTKIWGGCRKPRSADYLKRNLWKTQEVEKWDEKASNRERWKKITIIAIERNDEWPASPLQQWNQRKTKNKMLEINIVCFICHIGTDMVSFLFIHCLIVVVDSSRFEDIALHWTCQWTWRDSQDQSTTGAKTPLQRLHPKEYGKVCMGMGCSHSLELE